MSDVQETPVTDPIASSSPQEAPIVPAPQPSILKHEYEEVAPGQRLCVFSCNNKKYYIGVQIATLLKRETFNLYRSMKIKNVPCSRATHDQVLYLVKVGAVRTGTHSVTLVDHESCSAFLRENLKKRRSEPDALHLRVDFNRSPLKQRRASSASALGVMSPPPGRFFSPPEGAPDSAHRMPVSRHTPAAAGHHEPDTMIFVRDPVPAPPPPLPPPHHHHHLQQHPHHPEFATVIASHNGWYHRQPPMIWLNQPMVPPAAPLQWLQQRAQLTSSDPRPASLTDSHNFYERAEALVSDESVPDLHGSEL